MIEECPLCLCWDCDCKDILTDQEYKDLIEREKELDRKQ